MRIFFNGSYSQLFSPVLPVSRAVPADKYGGRSKGAGRTGREISVAHECPHPILRISSPCSSSNGGGSLMVPGGAGEIPDSGDVSTASSASNTELTTPHGTPAASKTAIHSAAFRCAIRSDNASTILDLCASRPAFVLNAESFASSSSPNTFAHDAHCLSLPTATMIGRSFAWKSW